MMNAERYLVLDLEATCDEGERNLPRDETEIIEIGAVLVDAETLKLIDEFQTFVKPVRHPTLTPFCTKLTTIQQADVDGAPTIAPAIARLAAFLRDRPALFCSWGAYDKNQLERESRRGGFRLPFGTTPRGEIQHWNLKSAFADRAKEKAMGTAGALRRVGLVLAGTHHRGIDDARNIARLLPWCLGLKPF
jgi:inhibitor of KinA sporulation pathway (predicted exonuclease)